MGEGACPPIGRVDRRFYGVVKISDSVSALMPINVEDIPTFFVLKPRCKVRYSVISNKGANNDCLFLLPSLDDITYTRIWLLTAKI